MPSHGRRASLLRVLRALATQTLAADRYEVIVVCDGDVDGSAAASREFGRQAPYRLRVLVQPNQGAGAARNAGVAAAASDLIVFLDDDVVPDRQWLAAHVTAHREGGAIVTIGPLLPPPHVRLNPWGEWEEGTLCRQYGDMTAGRWAPTYRQFHTGNAAVARRFIVEAGWFDPAFRRAEDVELALRLRDRGLRFIFLVDARGWHHVRRAFDAWLRMAADYGAADAAMARAGHAEVLAKVAAEYPRRNLAVRLMTPLYLRQPALRGHLVALLGWAARMAGVVRWRPAGNLACSVIFNARYYAALCEAMGGWPAFRSLIAGRPVAAVLALSSAVPRGDAGSEQAAADRTLVRWPNPTVSTIICTRDRPGSILGAVRSVLDGAWSDVEVLVLDQSTGDATEDLMARLARDDARVRYVRVPTRGKTRALNAGVGLARGRLLAFTDDDCVVSRDWLRDVVDAFDRERDLALLVGGVVAAPHDGQRGFIPTYEPPGPLRGRAVLTSGWSPMGANLAMRREIVDIVGPFDPVLGVGGPLRSSFDVEYCYRVYRQGYTVRALPDVLVTHHGFRTWEEGRRLVRAYALGTAAAYMKHVRLGDPLALLLLLRDISVYGWRASRQMARGRRPLHIAAVGYRLYGLLASYRFSIDRATRTYHDPEAERDGNHVGSGGVDDDDRAARQEAQVAIAGRTDVDAVSR